MTDCCHSGSILDLPYVLDLTQGQFVESENPPATGVVVDPTTGRKTGKQRIPPGVKVLQLSGCSDPQTSKELTWTNNEGVITRRGGALTLSFLETVSGESSDQNITLSALAQKVKDTAAKQNQTPTVSCTYKIAVDTPFYNVFDGQ